MAGFVELGVQPAAVLTPQLVAATGSAAEVPQPLMRRLYALLLRLDPQIVEVEAEVLGLVRRCRPPRLQNAVPPCPLAQGDLPPPPSASDPVAERSAQALLVQATTDLQLQVVRCRMLASGDAATWERWFRGWVAPEHLSGPCAGEEGVRILTHDLLAPLAALDAALDLLAQGEDGGAVRARRVGSLLRRRRQQLRSLLEVERLGLLVSWGSPVDLSAVVAPVLEELGSELEALQVVVHPRWPPGGSEHGTAVVAGWWGHAGALQEATRALFELLLLDEARMLGKRLGVRVGAGPRRPALRLLVAGVAECSPAAWVAPLPRRLQQRGLLLWQTVERVMRAHGGEVRWVKRQCTIIDLLLPMSGGPSDLSPGAG